MNLNRLMVVLLLNLIVLYAVDNRFPLDVKLRSRDMIDMKPFFEVSRQPVVESFLEMKIASRDIK